MTRAYEEIWNFIEDKAMHDPVCYHLVRARQEHPELATLIRFAFETYFPMVLFHDSLHITQPKAETTYFMDVSGWYTV